MTSPDREASTILIVDDQERNIQVVGTTLAAFGFDFMIANSGEQALERVGNRIPDLVLLDVLMPGMDGFQVCQAFQEVPGMEGVPVIFLSADDEKNTVVRALEGGGVDFITKPFNKAELLARVRAHLELKHSRDRLQELITAREKFVEVMAHDLKNWVGGANFGAKMLVEMKESLPEQAQRLSLTVDESSSKALEFIEEFLENTRSSRVDFELTSKRIDLVEVCRESKSHCEALAAAKGIKIGLNVPETAVFVESDRGAVLRIIDNLLSNAIKFSPRDSDLSLSLDDDPAVLTVEDCGPGFTDDDREQMFQPYKRLSARPTGGEISTGLGLSVVKQLADLLDLVIDVINTGQGARISLKF